MDKPDKWQAIDLFWNSFGLPAYDQNTVPSDAAFPYITYNASSGAMGGLIVLSASIWYYSESWEDISKKADQIAREIGHGYKIMSVDGGYLWITRGTPFAQRMSDEADDKIRRMYINTQAEFLTAY